jgi:NhaP-type Na+/H+ or K+/H+ antiporter
MLYTVATWFCLSNEWFTMGNYVHADPFKPVKLDLLPLMLFTSLLCSSDVVAAVSIVDYHEQPKLYSCIFGEGVFNDIVSIILFNTVNSL